MPELIYLAAPYSHKDPKVENERYRIVTEVASILIVKTGCEVFSPITHSHLLNRMAIRYGTVKNARWHPTYDFWLQFDFRMLDLADWLYILKLDGWQESNGIAAEKERFILSWSKTNHRVNIMKRIKYIAHSDFFKL
jgi:hypothetical protein